MTFSEQEIEWIVVEVVRRLGLPTENERVAMGERSSTTAELLLTERVVTLRTIEEKLNGITRLVVGHKAVVTPAVRDELKQRKIELIRQAGK